jgi:hypothetical protein
MSEATSAQREGTKGGRKIGEILAGEHELMKVKKGRK